MAGDEVNIRGKSYWQSSSTQPNNNYPITSTLLGFLSSFAGTSAVSSSLHSSSVTGSFLSNSASTATGLTDWLNNSVPTPTNKPKAYINWILFDEQFKPVSSSSNFIPVGEAGAVNSHNANASISKNGYLYVYCSNESNVDVFFDNLQVVHDKGPLLKETHYYPFGLVMAGVSSKAAGGIQNRYKFNSGNELQSGEFSEGSGIELYDAVHRMYDQQLGRFHQVDALADVAHRFSSYCFANDNPLISNDPLGLSTQTPGVNPIDNNDRAKLEPVTVHSQPKQKWGGFHWPSSTTSHRNEWKYNQHLYYSRTLNGESAIQKGDRESYKSSVGLYKKWDVEEKNYRAMQAWAVGILASPVLLSTAPSTVIAAMKMKLSTNFVGAAADFGIQAYSNGSCGKPILQNWNPVSTALAFGVGTPTHSLGNIAGVSLINATLSTSINLSQNSIAKGSELSFNLTSIVINTTFGTFSGANANELKVMFRNGPVSEAASQTFNFVGAIVDEKSKEK